MPFSAISSARITVCLVVAAVLLGVGAFSAVLAQDSKTKPEHPSARWESAIQKFEEQDRTNLPPTCHVLFVGSSSIRGWKLDKSFPGLNAINRGFGGSQIADSIHFADRIIIKHQPRVVVLYAGDNDIAKGKSPATVTSDFTKFTVKIHESLPETKIVFIAIKPSLARWKLVEKMRTANDGIRAICDKHPRLEFVDIDTPMIGDDGKPKPELFLKDGLHMTEAGYQIWARLVLPHLDPRK